MFLLLISVGGFNAISKVSSQNTTKILINKINMFNTYFLSMINNKLINLTISYFNIHKVQKSIYNL
jgi:hypothetical protein